MGSAESQVAKKLVDVLLDMFPLPPMARKVIGVPIGYVLDRAGSNQKATISSIAARIASDLSQYPDQENPGSAISASYDVVDILKKSGLGAEQLVALDLDEDRIFAHLLTAAQPVLANASQLRQGFIRSGLQQIAKTVVKSAPELPGVQVAFMQAMLKFRHDRAA